MTLFPIVERELRSASTRSGTYWRRVWVGFLGILVMSAVVVFNRFLPGGMVGAPGIFKFVRFFALFYCLLAGARLTSDCISQEKRDGTLGFLFLTPLRGYDVILGKLLAKGVLPVYTLMAIVPVVWLLSLLGGVTGGELFFTVIALGNSLFFSLAVGIAVSTVFRDRRRCDFIATMIVILVFLVLFPTIDLLIFSLMNRTAAPWGGGSDLISFLTDRVNALASPTFWGTSGYQATLISNGIVHLSAWCFIAIASWWVPHCWQDKPPGGARLSLRMWWTQWTYGSGPKRALRRKTALDNNAFFWRVTRNRLRPLTPWLCIFATLGIPLLIVLSVGFSAPGFYIFLVPTIVCWYLVPKFWIAAEAARTLSEERGGGTLEMVLSTPLTVREIIRGQWMGLKNNYGIAVIFPVVVSVILIILINFVPSMTWLSDIPYATSVLVAGAIMFLADCFTLGWVGMWSGLRLGNAKAAARIATVRVITFPTLFFAVSFALISTIIIIPARTFPGGSPYVPIGLWLVMGLVIDAALIKISRGLIYKEFRNVVQEPATGKNAWARALGQWLGSKFRRKRNTG